MADQTAALLTEHRGHGVVLRERRAHLRCAIDAGWVQRGAAWHAGGGRAPIESDAAWASTWFVSNRRSPSPTLPALMAFWPAVLVAMFLTVKRTSASMKPASTIWRSALPPAARWNVLLISATATGILHSFTSVTNSRADIWNASAIDLELLASRLQYLRRDGAKRAASGMW